MKERPILMSAPMVRALLAGTKTQTRRIVKPQQPREMQPLDFPWELEITERNGDITAFTKEQFAERCPYGAPGDRLWVKETWGHDAPDLETCRAANEDAMPSVCYGPYYRATEVAPDTLSWRPSIHMPRWASRITLEVTAVRVERLHDITDEDARAEGVVEGIIPADEYGPVRVGYVLGEDDGKCTLYPTEREAFGAGWKAINGDDSWQANSFVWVVAFRRVEESEEVMT